MLLQGCCNGWQACLISKACIAIPLRPISEKPFALPNHRPVLDLWRCRKSFRNWGSSVEGAGATNQPGLPHAKGQWQGGLILAGTESGVVFASSLGQANIQGDPSSFLHATIGIDLSRGSDIYGNSDTVMPASINQPVCLYLGRPAQV